MTGEFPSNSHKRRPPEEKLESVVVNKAVPGKKPLGKRLREMFFPGDGRSAVQSVLADVIIPQVKDMAAEAAREALERVIFGDRGTSRRSNSYRPGAGSGYTNYGSRYSGRGHSARPTREEGPNAQLNSDDIEYILLRSRAEADEVLYRLGETIEKYGMATIADLKGLIGWSSDLTDQDWGWEILDTADIRKERNNGYLLNLPKPLRLD